MDSFQKKTTYKAYNKYTAIQYSEQRLIKISDYVQTTGHSGAVFLVHFKTSAGVERDAQGETERSTSSFSDEEGETGMSSSSSSEHLAAEHLQLCEPAREPLLLPSFLCLTLRFWNQILTCFSDKFRYVAISMRRSLERYMLEVNSRSSSRSCVLVKAVRMRLLL